MFGIDDLIAGGMNIANSQASAGANFEYQKKLMEYQDKYQRDFLRDSFGIKREGLKSAGYNPLLALDNMNSSGSIATGGSINMDTSNPFAAATNANSAKQQAKIAKDVGESTKNLNNQNADRADAEADRVRRLTDKELDVMDAKIRNLDATNAKAARDLIKTGSFKFGPFGMETYSAPDEINEDAVKRKVIRQAQRKMREEYEKRKRRGRDIWQLVGK